MSNSSSLEKLVEFVAEDDVANAKKCLKEILKQKAKERILANEKE